MKNYLDITIELLQVPIIRALIYIIGSVIVAKIVDWIITKVLSRVVSKTTSSIDDKIIQILHRPIYFSILFIGLGISVKLLNMPEILSYIFLGIFKTIAVIIWSFALFQSLMHFISWYRYQGQKDNILKIHTLPVFDNVGKVIIFILSGFLILLSWGVNITGLTVSATVLVGIFGFAAQDTLANLFAGFFIMADTPYKIGDYINLDGGERGYVKTIGLRSTRIMTRDDIEITLPNSLIANSKIINESGGQSERERVRINISASYGTNLNKIRELLVNIAKSNNDVCTNPVPRLRFRSFGESGLMFQLLFWIEKPADRGRITDEINSNIYEKFIEQKIEIPYPQRTIHIKNSKNLI